MYNTITLTHDVVLTLIQRCSDVRNVRWNDVVIIIAFSASVNLCTEYMEQSLKTKLNFSVCHPSWALSKQLQTKLLENKAGETFFQSNKNKSTREGRFEYLESLFSIYTKQTFQMYIVFRRPYSDYRIKFWYIFLIVIFKGVCDWRL